MRPGKVEVMYLNGESNAKVSRPLSGFGILEFCVVKWNLVQQGHSVSCITIVTILLSKPAITRADIRPQIIYSLSCVDMTFVLRCLTRHKAWPIYIHLYYVPLLSNHFTKTNWNCKSELLGVCVCRRKKKTFEKAIKLSMYVYFSMYNLWKVYNIFEHRRIYRPMYIKHTWCRGKQLYSCFARKALHHVCFITSSIYVEHS